VRRLLDWGRARWLPAAPAHPPRDCIHPVELRALIDALIAERNASDWEREFAQLRPGLPETLERARVARARGMPVAAWRAEEAARPHKE
jgi:hypothetical protein